ncbi:MAG: response regulator, partial [Gemmatimonadetes bacterium]|nr:response regulator [Gemmatimonadota bacterium]
STFKIVMGERAPRPVRAEEVETSPARLAAGVGPEGRLEESVATRRGGEVVTALPAEAAETVGTTGKSVVDGDQAVDGKGGIAAVSPAAAGDSDGKSKQGGWSDFKVLVVDDEKDSRVLIRHYLEDFGCRVFTASNGEDGLELARRHSPDLITLDLIMPGLSGWEVLKRLKSDAGLRAIPVVVVSVVANEGRGKLLGAVDLVTKPFEREDLLRVLWRNLGRRRGGRVLLVTGDRERADSLSRVVRARGFDTTTRRGGDMVQILGHEAPDAVVLDMERSSTHGVASLLELREDRLHTGLPVLVLTHGGLNDKEREIIGELATVHTSAAKAAEALAYMLDVSFPVGLQDTEG